MEKRKLTGKSAIDIWREEGERKGREEGREEGIRLEEGRGRELAVRNIMASLGLTEKEARAAVSGKKIIRVLFPELFE